MNDPSEDGEPPMMISTSVGNNSTNSAEKSIKSCYAVIYSLQNRKWVVSGEGGWSEVHLCRDSSDNTHRLLAWTVKLQQVLLNANCNADCMYKEKSQNFHSFTDENGQRFGLGFHKSDSGLRQAEQFLNAVVTVIEECKKANGDIIEPEIPESPPEEEEEVNTEPVKMMYSPKTTMTNSVQPPPLKQRTVSTTSTTSMKRRPPPPSSRTLTNSNLYHSNHNIHNNHPNIHNQPHYNNINESVNRSPSFNSMNHNQNNKDDDNNNSTPHRESRVAALSSLYERNNEKKVPSSPISRPLPPLTIEHKNTMTNKMPPLPTQEDGEDEKKDTSSPSPGTSEPRFEIKKRLSLTDQPDYHLKINQTKTVPMGTPKLGKLIVHPPKPQKFQKQDDKISDVTFVERTVQVTYDKEAGVFHGLPKEWEELLNKQFGVEPKHIPGVKLPQYTAKIPRVLVTLKEKLVGADGYQQVGIFRLAPDARDNNAVKSSIDSGRFEVSNTKADVNVYANLIKVWFRDLPAPLLSCVAPERVEMASREEDVVKIVADFPEPHKSIFLWLCDMCVECAVFEDVNKMGPKNLAIVIGPNLFNTTQFENPMKAMTYSAKVVEFFEKAIKWRQSTQ